MRVAGHIDTGNIGTGLAAGNNCAVHNDLTCVTIDRSAMLLCVQSDCAQRQGFVRSFQIHQTKALKRIGRNNRTASQGHRVLDNQRCVDGDFARNRDGIAVACIVDCINKLFRSADSFFSLCDQHNFAVCLLRNGFVLRLPRLGHRFHGGLIVRLVRRSFLCQCCCRKQ